MKKILITIILLLLFLSGCSQKLSHIDGQVISVENEIIIVNCVIKNKVESVELTIDEHKLIHVGDVLCFKNVVLSKNDDYLKGKAEESTLIYCEKEKYMTVYITKVSQNDNFLFDIEFEFYDVSTDDILSKHTGIITDSTKKYENNQYVSITLESNTSFFQDYDFSMKYDDIYTIIPLVHKNQN